MSEKGVGFESTDEWRWPVINLPIDASVYEQLERRAAEYAEQIVEDENEQESVWVILKHDYDRNHDTGGTYPKTDAYLRLMIIDELLAEGQVDTSELHRRIHRDPELVNQVFTIKLYDPVALDNMLRNAAADIDQRIT